MLIGICVGLGLAGWIVGGIYIHREFKRSGMFGIEPEIAMIALAPIVIPVLILAMVAEKINPSKDGDGGLSAVAYGLMIVAVYGCLAVTEVQAMKHADTCVCQGEKK